ncbi:Pinoresinol reductase 1 isoform 2 [Theobroma cacao]|uniref:Pinoresinol reductase 1 isoform 2 n=1 Tax=Theobroma cacao TaxID=3641 RepID=A0A061GE29_THECC|nr:Pinoresinol reductase 1 isoform 2 [Theobroma cacao]
MAKSKVLVVGGTGYIGRRIVKASLAQGHETYVLQRAEIGLDIDKLQMLLSFKKQGAHLVEGSFNDHKSLVEAVKQADVVICTMSGVHFRSHNISLQLKLVAFMDEDDIATYTINAIDDPRTLNKTLYIRPPGNILTQAHLIQKWEELSGKKLEKISISAQDFLASMKGLDFAGQVGVGHFYHIFYEGCLTNFEIGEGVEEASRLYPEVEYTRMDDYLKIYI